MKNQFLVGKNLYLRPLEKSDAKGNYVSWLNDEEVCAYNSHHFLQYTTQKAESYIEKVNKSNNDIILAIILKENNVHIGNIALQRINLLHRNAEFAILLGNKEFWGKGYSKEASNLILEHGFKNLNLHRIHCGTSEDNFAMQKLAKYLNMEKEGEEMDAIFKNGKFKNFIKYYILQKNFIAN